MSAWWGQGPAVHDKTYCGNMPQTFSEPLREPRCYITLHLRLRLHLCCGLLTFKEVVTPSLRCPPFIMINTILITSCKFTPSWKAACCLMDRKSMGAGTYKEPRVSATSIPATCSTVFLIFPHQYHDKAQNSVYCHDPQPALNLQTRTSSSRANPTVFTCVFIYKCWKEKKWIWYKNACEFDQFHWWRGFKCHFFSS